MYAQYLFLTFKALKGYRSHLKRNKIEKLSDRRLDHYRINVLVLGDRD